MIRLIKACGGHEAGDERRGRKCLKHCLEHNVASLCRSLIEYGERGRVGESETVEGNGVEEERGREDD